MEAGLLVFIVVFMLGLVIGVITTATLKARIRRIIALAAAMGLDFHEQPPSDFDKPFKHFYIFKKAPYKINFVVKGTFEGQKVAVFDLESAKVKINIGARLRTIIAVHIQNSDMPIFILAPKGPIVEILESYGYHEIENLPDVKYYLGAIDPDHSKQHMDPQRTNELINRKPSMIIEGKGEWLLFYGKAPFQPRELEHKLAEAIQLGTLFQ